MNGLDDFQALVAGYQDAIYRVAYRLTGHPEDAEDLVQESLIEAFQAFGRFRLGTRFDHWLYRIMTRNYIDRFRRRRRLDTVSLEEVSRDGETGDFADSSSDPQALLEKNQWSESLQAALAQLTPDFRAVVVLCDAQGLSYEETSKVLGCPIGTVRSRLHRARCQLRTWLRPHVEAVGGK